MTYRICECEQFFNPKDVEQWECYTCLSNQGGRFVFNLSGDLVRIRNKNEEKSEKV